MCIESITKTHTDPTRENSDYGISFKGQVDFSKISQFLCFIEPIQLREEWLLKFGYSIDESNSAGKVFSFIKEVGFVNDDPKIIYFSKTGKFMRRSLEINSVHQLQNLYFALVGEELVLQD